MKAKSIKGNSTEEIRLSMEQSIGPDFKPTLALIFCSIVHDHKAITNLFDQQGIAVFGATSGGEIFDDIATHQGISVLLMDIQPSNFQLLYGDYDELAPENLAKELAAKAKSFFARPAFIVSNSTSNMARLDVGEKILRAILEVVGEEAEVWGGSAGDDMAFRETFVFTNARSGSKAILFLVLDGENVIVKGHAASGLKPAGIEKTITKANGNWIIEIDHKPAAEFIPRFVGVTLNQHDYKDFNMQDIYMGLYRGNADPVIRSSAGFNWENKAIAVSGTVQEGDRVRMMLPPDFEIIDDLNSQAIVFRNTEMPDADGLIMFSCIGRLNVLGPLVDDELKGIRSVYNKPMTGFFTYGEFGRASRGHNEFHNMTCCWVALKEK